LLVEGGSLLSLREEVKPGFIWSVSSFTVKVTGVFHYYSGFPDDAGIVGPDVVCDSYCVQVDAVFTCRQFCTMHWLMKYLSLSP
jgi:hypothetical protein